MITIHTEWSWPKGIECDRETKLFTVLGHQVPIGWLDMSWGVTVEAEPDMPNSDTETVVWMTWLCGESGWYLNVSIYEDGGIDGYLPDMGTGPPGPDARGTEDCYKLWRQLCSRRDPFVGAPDCLDDPYGFLEPGTWMWPDPCTPEEYREVYFIATRLVAQTRDIA